MLGDDVVDAEVPCLKQLINCYDEYKTSILGVQQVEKSQVSKYGIVKNLNIEKGIYKVKDLIEKPSVQESPSNIAILGKYILMPDIFKVLEKTKPGKGDEIQLTDALKNLLEDQAIYAYEFQYIYVLVLKSKKLKVLLVFYRNRYYVNLLQNLKAY